MDSMWQRAREAFSGTVWLVIGVASCLGIAVILLVGGMDVPAFQREMTRRVPGSFSTMGQTEQEGEAGLVVELPDGQVVQAVAFHTPVVRKGKPVAVVEYKTPILGRRIYRFDRYLNYEPDWLRSKIHLPDDQ